MDSKKIKSAISILSIILVISSLLAAFTFATKVISVDGEIKTQGVDISITAGADDSEVMPGKAVKYEPKIQYKGVDSWIRLRLDISNENIKEEYFQGLGDDWIKKGEYFYYTKHVHHNEEIKTFDSFKIPYKWDELEPENLMDSSFQVVALCDAVQADNFTPDFNSEKPWGELEIEDSDYDGSEYSDKENIIKHIDLEFLGAGQYTLSSKDIILDVLPGDIYENEINIYNEGKHETEVFFYVSDAELKENSLLDAVKLKMEIDGKPFYDGTLRAAKLTKEQSLCYMKPGEKHILSYEITVPAELKNDYQDKLDFFTWNFSSIEYPKVPKTGDTASFLIYIMIASLSLILLIKVKRKESKKDEK